MGFQIDASQLQAQDAGILDLRISGPQCWSSELGKLSTAPHNSSFMQSSHVYIQRTTDDPTKTRLERLDTQCGLAFDTCLDP